MKKHPQNSLKYQPHSLTKNLILILVILGFLVYSNALFNQFVWDDKFQPIGNSRFSVWQNLNHFYFDKLQDFHYRPLFFSYLYLINITFGPQPFIYHALQISLHLVNGILIFLFLVELFGATPAFFAALLFLVHPINQEAIGFISATADVLFFTFGMLAFHLSRQTYLTRIKLLTIGLLVLMSLLVKENGVIFVFLIPLYQVLVDISKLHVIARIRQLTETRQSLMYINSHSREIPPRAELGRNDEQHNKDFAQIQIKRRQTYKLVLTTGMAFAIYLILRLGIAGIFVTHSVFSPIMRQSFVKRLTSMPAIFLYYLKTFFWPVNLAISQQWLVASFSSPGFYRALVVGIGVIGVIGLIWVKLNKNSPKLARKFAFFAIWFFLGIGVHLQILPLDMTVADRWFYLPLVGLLGMFTCLFVNIKVNQYIKKGFVILLVCVITLLGARTVMRNQDWRDGLTLFSHDIELSRESYDLENNYGRELLNLGKYAEAESHLLRSIELEPKSPINWHNLGIVYIFQIQPDKARAAFTRAIANNEDFYQAYEYLAVLLIKNFSANDAQMFAKHAVVKFPEDPALWHDLAAAELQLNHHKEALSAAQKAFNLLPNEENLKLLNYLKNLPN